jgi:uncharacterized membrane protein YeiH
MSHLPFIDAIGWFGLVVFVVSGALAAGRQQMDLIGFILLGSVTGIGGGTLRDLVLARPVFWVAAPDQLIACVVVSLLTFFFVPGSIARTKGIVWSDALGLAAFAVQGAHTALDSGAPFVVAVVMGVMTAVGGGVIRDVISGDRPFIVRGELYASTALAGAVLFVTLATWGVPAQYAEICGFVVTLGMRGAAICFDIHMGPPGQFLSVGNRGESEGEDRPPEE